MICVVAGLAVLAQVGVVTSDGSLTFWPLLPVVGMTVFGMLRRPGRGGSRTEE
jgi:hypothetical protein